MEIKNTTQSIQELINSIPEIRKELKDVELKMKEFFQ